ALGGACHSQSTRYAGECRAGFCSGNTCPGKCTAYVGTGDTCDAALARCDPLKASCAAGQCNVYSRLGEPCTGAACGPGLVCANDVQPQPICVQPRALGEACQSTYQCPSSSVCYQNQCR